MLSEISQAQKDRQLHDTLHGDSDLFGVECSGGYRNGGELGGRAGEGCLMCSKL